jgi:aspartyl-tRNA synthetase
MEQSPPGSSRDEDVSPLTAHSFTSEQVLIVQLVENHQQDVIRQLIWWTVTKKTHLHVTGASNAMKKVTMKNHTRSSQSQLKWNYEDVNSDKHRHAEQCRSCLKSKVHDKSHLLKENSNKFRPLWTCNWGLFQVLKGNSFEKTSQINQI